MRKIIALASLVLLTGCLEDTPTMPLHKAAGATAQKEQHEDLPPPKENARVTVTLLGSFQDSLAYNGGRGVYLITDKQTGQEFIGVSGIGISETGSHRSGKTTISDER